MATVKTLIAEIVDGEPLEIEPVNIDIKQLSLVLIDYDGDCIDKITWSPEVVFNRTIDILEHCSLNEHCYEFGSTCDEIYLPPGRYTAYMCTIDNKYLLQAGDMRAEINLIIEPISADYATAAQLNKDGCE